MRDLAKLLLVGILIALLCAVAPGNWGQVKPGLGSRVDLSHPLARDLVAYWAFSEGGGRPHDSGPFARHGTLQNTVKWISSAKGPVLDFAGGSADRVEVGTFSVVSSGFTMACWVYLDSVLSTRDDRFISKADGTAQEAHDWMLGQQQSGSVDRFRVRINRSAKTLRGNTAASGLAGQWAHVVGVFDNGNGKIYVNGLEDSPYTDGSGSGHTGVGIFNSGTLPNNTNLVYIGNQPTAATAAPDGKIAEVSLYARALSAAEIQQLYQNPYAFIRPTIISRALFGSPAGAPPANKLNRLLITD